MARPHCHHMITCAIVVIVFGESCFVTRRTEKKNESSGFQKCWKTRIPLGPSREMYIFNPRFSQ